MLCLCRQPKIRYKMWYIVFSQYKYKQKVRYNISQQQQLNYIKLGFILTSTFYKWTEYTLYALHRNSLVFFGVSLNLVTPQRTVTAKNQ